MSTNRIRDIPTFRALTENVETCAQFKKAWPVLKPFFQLLGADVSNMEAAFERLDDLRGQVDALTSAPDQFNDLFLNRGWIMYEGMDLGAALEAIDRAEADGVEAGEQVLLDHYDTETLDFQLGRVSTVEAFRPRMPLARKAFDDHKAERYHACVPVVLALMDGLVQDVYSEAHGEDRGLSSEEVSLEAWDSIAGHSSGLEKLADLMRKGRRRLRVEKIDLPYRNGIMHGMDMGYDNRVVAIKTWAALFAVRDWALKAEQGELEAPDDVDDENPSLDEALEQLRETEETRRDVRKWEPRRLVVGEDIPEAGEPEDYPDGTPSQALVRFLKFWMQDNYGYMADELRRVGTGNPFSPGEVRDDFSHTALAGFRLLKVEDFSPACTDITLELDRKVFEEAEQVQVKVRMTYSKEDWRPAVYGHEDGEWYLTTRLNLIT